MTIYALGSNGSGQLGIGNTEDVSVLTPLVTHDSLAVHDICDIASGGNHTLFLTKSGRVYAAGSNEDGRCALVQDMLNSLVPTECALVNTGTKIKYCAATWSASIFVTDEDQIFVCGTGNNGELGLGKDVIFAPSPQIITSPSIKSNASIVQLVAGMSHVVLLLSDGSMFGWGNGRNGQIGGPDEVVWTPRDIRNISFVVTRITCGKDFTLVASDPRHGQFALYGPNRRDRFDIKNSMPLSLPDWKCISSSWGNMYVVTNSGQVVSHGRNDHGQSGPSNLPPIQSLRAGSEHVIALTVDGRVLVWGWGEHGNCGSETDKDQDVKDRLQELRFEHRPLLIAAGCATTFIITEG